jgi:DNA mismatch repair protein MutS
METQFLTDEQYHSPENQNRENPILGYRTVQKNEKAKTETPLMQQYNRLKEKYPDCLLLFRINDFYQAFGPDAEKISQVCGIVLVHPKDSEKPVCCGFNFHFLDCFLPKLVNSGYKVAICDQLH